MRRLIIVLVALLFASACTVAAESDELVIQLAVPESDTAVGTSLVAVREAAPAVVRAAVTRLHLVGNGIAISEENPFDFMHARAVVGAVKVANADTNSGVVATRLGVLLLDEKIYHLRDIAVSLDEISAEIYDPVLSAAATSSAIGEIKVKRFEKPGRDIWAGNMVLNDAVFNVYFLGVKREFRLAEVTQKIGDFCSSNSDDPRCNPPGVECTSDPEQCRDRIANYCQNNTTDTGCLQLKKLYCLHNAADERCREYLKELCEKYPNQMHCSFETVEGRKVVGIDPTGVSAVTAESGEAAKTLVASKQRPTLTVARNKVDAVSYENLGPSAAAISAKRGE